MLRHESALDIGLANGEEHRRHGFCAVSAHIGHSLREFDFPGLGIEQVLQMLVDNAVFHGYNTIVTRALIAQLRFSSVNQRHLFAYGLHGFRIHFNAPDRLCIGAAPVEIHPSVIILKQVGIPESKRGVDLLKFPRQRVFRP